MTTIRQERRYADNLRRFRLAREEVVSGRMTIEQAAVAYRVQPVALRLDDEVQRAIQPDERP